MGGYETLTTKILAQAKSHIAREHDLHRAELAEIYANVILERPGPRAIERRFTADQLFFRDVWIGFIEIQNSRDALKDFEVLVRRFPFSKTRIARTRYLRLVIEAYLAEAYILRERMTAYLTKIGRLFRGHESHPHVLSQTRPLFEVVTRTLKPLTDLRSSHTHRHRYDSAELARLGTLELLSIQIAEDETQAMMKAMYDEAWSRYRKMWRQSINANNKAITELLDVYSDTLVDVLFEENGSFKPHTN